MSTSRDVSRGGFTDFQNQLGLLNWHNILIHSNKTVKVIAVVTLLITAIYMYILIYRCLSRWIQRRVKVVLAPLFHPLQIILGCLLTYAKIPLSSVILYQHMKQIVSCILQAPPTIPQPSNQYTIGQPYLIDITTITCLCVMQISWLASFLFLKNKVTLYSFQSTVSPNPLLQRSTIERSSSFYKSQNLP